MIALINGLQPGEAFAFGALISAAVVIALFSIFAAWDVSRSGSQESMSERHDRLDGEAATRTTSSARKSGRAR